MIFTELSLPGVWLIESEPFDDKRGRFYRTYDWAQMAQKWPNARVEQSNVSVNPHEMTLRGFHAQRAPWGEAKTLTCITGRIDDVVLDLRPESPTFKQHCTVSLQGPKMLHVPAGTANAFLTREPNTIVTYITSTPYTPEAEFGIRWDDPTFQVKWYGTPRLISDKDRSHPDWTP